jgi:hypothetical protein
MRAFGIFNPPFDGAQAIVFSVSLFDGGRAVDGESESQLHVPLGTPAQRLHEIYDFGGSRLGGTSIFSPLSFLRSSSFSAWS